jgi:hypothetical protein
VANDFPNSRWRKYLMNLWSRDLSSWRLYYARYLTVQWNSTHPLGTQVKTFTIYFMLEKTGPDGEAMTPQPIVLWEHRCKPGDF